MRKIIVLLALLFTFEANSQIVYSIHSDGTNYRAWFMSDSTKIAIEKSETYKNWLLSTQYDFIYDTLSKSIGLFLANVSSSLPDNGMKEYNFMPIKSTHVYNEKTWRYDIVYTQKDTGTITCVNGEIFLTYEYEKIKHTVRSASSPYVSGGSVYYGDQVTTARVDSDGDVSVSTSLNTSISYTYGKAKTTVYMTKDKDHNFVMKTKMRIL